MRWPDTPRPAWPWLLWWEYELLGQPVPERTPIFDKLFERALGWD